MYSMLISTIVLLQDDTVIELNTPEKKPIEVLVKES